MITTTTAVVIAQIRTHSSLFREKAVRRCGGRYTQDILIHGSSSFEEETLRCFFPVL